MPGYEHALDPAHTVTGHRLEQRLEQARDLVRRVFRVSRLCRAARRKGCSDHTGAKIAIRRAGMLRRAWRRKPRQQPQASPSRRKDRPIWSRCARWLWQQGRARFNRAPKAPAAPKAPSTRLVDSQPGEQGLDLDHAQFASSKASHALTSSIGKVMAGNVATFCSTHKEKDHVHPQGSDLEKAQCDRR